MRALAGLTVLVLTAACHCGTPSHPVTSDLRVMPTALDFGDVAIGASLALTFAIANGGRAPADTTLSVEGPFTLSMTTASIGGGASATLTVTFTPTQLGAASGAVHVADVGDVQLGGNGLLACVASRACLSSTFDLTSRKCVEAALADDSSCFAPCLAGQGTCRGGYCVGNATSCIDADACTLDVCTADGGCFHPGVVCPVTDPCQAQFCDAASGCGSQAVEDGTPCGVATCEDAHICLNGACQLRTRPNALADCRYTALQAGDLHTCAVTRGGDLRCWGSNTSDQQARGFPSAVAPPGFASGLGSVRSVAIAPPQDTWVARTSADVGHTNGPELLPINATQLAAGLSNTVCGIEHGTLRCAVDAGAPFSAADDAVAVSMSRDELCIVSLDGGVACGGPGALAAVSVPRPATDVSSARRGTGCALIGDQGFCWGDLVDGGARIVWDAGVTAISTTRFASRIFGPAACAATTGGIRCIEAAVGTRTTSAAPAPVSALTLGFFHGCALLADGHAVCWGSNQYGQLGERSPQPLGVQRTPVRATWLGQLDGNVLFAASNGPVQAMTRLVVTSDDAGMQWARPEAQVLSGSPASYAVGCPCGVDAGSDCGRFGPVPVDGALACAGLGTSPVGSVAALCVARAGGDVRCVSLAGTVVDQWNAGGEVAALAGEYPGPGQCARRTDGTVRCHGITAGNAVAESLTDVEELCFGDLQHANGCARLHTGELRCWGDWVGSATPRTPLGAWPGARQVSCGALHVCALSGINIVRCWGGNTFGQLGRDGPARTTATEVPMPAPVVSIAAGASHTCALLESSEVLCWGDNTLGQLGQPVLMGSKQPLTVTQ